MLFPSFFNAGAPTYEIEQSLRFDGSSYLSRTFNSSESSTFSVWVKRGDIVGTNNIFGARQTSGSTYRQLFFEGGTPYGLGADNVPSQYAYTNNDLRDSSAWYHIVYSTGSNDTRIWINGVEASYRLDTNGQGGSITNSPTAYLGSSWNNTNKFNGYIAEFHHIDGQQLDPDNFGEYDSNGVWRPIRVAGLTYGTNGFYLKFDPSATNGIGHDHSGNGNHWTPTGFSVANGSYIQDCSTVSGGGSFAGAFDGNLGTAAGSDNFNGEVWTWAPSGGYAYTSSVEVYGGEAAYDQARINNDSYVAMNGGWKTIKTGSGTITKLDVRDSRGNAAASIGAIRIDGTILVDNRFQDVLPDTPTNNWCTLNPLSLTRSTLNDPNDGNLGIECVGGTWDRGTKGTIGVSSGKWYWEYTHGSISSGYPTADIGITKYESMIDAYYHGGSGSTDTYLIQGNNGNKYNNGGSAYGSAFTTGDICSIALDLDNGKVWFGKNGTWFNSGDPAAGTNAAFTGLSGTFWPLFYWGISAGTSGINQAYFNFGQRAFDYTPPTGFKSLNTSNLPAPTVKDGSENFNTVLYTGDNNNPRDIDLGADWDLIWVKNRTSGYSHNLVDRVRGTLSLYPDVTGAEGSEGQPNGYVDSYITNGIRTRSSQSSGGAYFNEANNNYVAWNWKANGSGSSNTDGSITSTVSVNPTAGFSIVSYTGTGANATVGHGLGVAPSAVIVKNRDDGTKGWPSQFTALGNNYLELNGTSGTFTGSGYFNNTAPTSTVFSVGTIGSTNASGDDFIAYCFAEVEGYSKFGTYIGNGNSTDGPFVSLSFAPALIIIKKNAVANWVLMDKERYAYNPRTQVIYPSGASPEVSLSGTADIDFLSEGFKIRRSWDNINAWDTTYVFMAFAENPFGGSGVSPATAR
jgi:hypothetical protein